MPRLMSFAKTKRQVQEGTKDITRRLGWDFLSPGDLLWPVHKCMGFRKGECPVKLRDAPIEVIHKRMECLDALLGKKMDPVFSCYTPFYTEVQAWKEVEREGFPGQSPAWFVEMFCELNKCERDVLVNRIVFRYQDESVKFFDRDHYPEIPAEVAICPKCEAGLIIEDIDEWESETGRVTEGGLHIACSKAPDIGSRNWEDWFSWHYDMPYVYWLPVDVTVYKWFDKRYRYDAGGPDVT